MFDSELHVALKAVLFAICWGGMIYNLVRYRRGRPIACLAQLASAGVLMAAAVGLRWAPQGTSSQD